MADKTKIQWCDATVNPIMGCAGCELYLAPNRILRFVDDATDIFLSDPSGSEVKRGCWLSVCSAKLGHC